MRARTCARYASGLMSFSFAVPSSHTACAMVMHTNSVSVVDPYTAMSFVPHGLIVKPFSPSVTCEFQLLWPRYRSPSKLAQMLLTEIRKGISDYDCILEKALATTKLR